MNRTQKILSATIAAGLVTLAFAEFTGIFEPFPIRGEASLVAGVAAGLIALFIHDYSRRSTPLRPLARVVRPARRVRTAPCGIATRRAAAIVEHAA